MENQIIIKPTFDAKSIFKANLFLFTNRKITIYVVAMLAVLAVNFYNEPTKSNSSFFWGTYMVIISLYVAFLLYRTYSVSKKQISENPKIKEDITYIINHEFFQEKGESFDIKYFWKDAFKVVEKKDFFLVYIKKCVAKIIKREDLTDNQYNELKALFNSLDIKKSLK